MLWNVGGHHHHHHHTIVSGHEMGQQKCQSCVGLWLYSSTRPNTHHTHTHTCVPRVHSGVQCLAAAREDRNPYVCDVWLDSSRQQVVAADYNSTSEFVLREVHTTYVSNMRALFECLSNVMNINDQACNLCTNKNNHIVCVWS